jgi:hypothetical protein
MGLKEQKLDITEQIDTLPIEDGASIKYTTPRLICLTESLQLPSGFCQEQTAMTVIQSLHTFEETFANIAQGMVGLDAIGAMLAGSQKTRLGLAMPADIRQMVTSRVAQIMKNGDPIPIATNWGPRIHYAEPQDQIVSIAELSALKVLIGLQNSIKKIYPPGASVTIFLEDFTGLVVEGGIIDPTYIAPHFLESVEMYYQGMHQLVSVLDDTQLRLVRESYLACRSGNELKDWIKQCKVNYDAFIVYFQESAEAGVVPTDEHDQNRSYTELRSYKVLQELGWVGAIPQNMRDHYLRRIACLDSQSTAGSANQMMARMFAAILFHVQDQTFCRSDMFTSGKPLRHSFVEPVPGSPLIIAADKFFTKSYLDKSAINAPAWACKGVAVVDPCGTKARPSLRSWRNPAKLGESLIPAVLNLPISGKILSLRSDMVVSSM